MSEPVEYIVTVKSKVSGHFNTPMDTQARAVAFAALCIKNETAELKDGDTVTVTISKTPI